MRMHNPPHPGEFIREIYLQPFRISSRSVAEKLKVSPSTFNRLVNGASNVSPEMALRLSKTLGRSAESWLAMQDNYDLWRARDQVNLAAVEKLDISAA
ncbi:MAG: HigA family addiction module antidote protein [Candidatus Marinimicrobia bacterium]|nr:HigA family addiction module antidote protein [Candidatus Neomarinimicrobiota bacterium]